MKQTFDEWWRDHVASLDPSSINESSLQCRYFAAKEAWEYRDSELQSVIKILNNIYYAPPMDLPPTRGDDFKKVCLYLENYINELKEVL